MTCKVTVNKRNGSVEVFSTDKIKNVIAWACANLDVNPLHLESKIETLNVEGISTVQIHDNVIHHAQSLATGTTPDWVIVAGRLNTMKRWKDTLAYEMEFKTFVQDMILAGRYKHENILGYTDEQLDYLEKSLVQNNDLNHSYGSTLTANRKYLMEGECIQHMFMVNSMIVFAGQPLDKVLAMYKALSERKISLATPWLSNLRSGGNISSCFIISLDDSSQSISNAIESAINISRMGGGLGIYLGNLRAEGSKISGREGAAKSVTMAARVFNDIALWFDQGGKRAGAFTVALPVWHNDIEDFLEIQSEVGDLRTKAYDIFPQVCIPDLFMKIDKHPTDRTWYTFCPFELVEHGVDIKGKYGKEFEFAYSQAVTLAESGKLRVFTKVDTRSIIKQIMRTQFDSGLPYIAFTDTINAKNPNSHMGSIPCTNLCVESYSVVIPDTYSHTCNLASIVSGRMDSDEDYIYYSGLLVDILDSGIELTHAPTEISNAHNNALRTIGIGQQGMHDHLVKSNKNYHNAEEFTKVAELIQYGAVKRSMELAQEKGYYPLFKGSRWYSGEQIDDYITDSVTTLDWVALKQAVKHFGIRNSQLTSPAPNTSTSVFMDASAGMLPVYASFFREDNDNGKYPVACMYLKESPLGYSQGFRTYDQKVLARAIGATQKFVDTGISAEYLLDHNRENFSAKDLYELIHECWEQKTKAIYYIRSIKKGETVDDLLGIKDEGCVGCAG